MKIKLCGFKNKDSTLAAIKAGADFLGFVFVENSPRFLDLKSAIDLKKTLPSNINKVAVVADAEPSYLAEIIEKFSPNYIQFHGEENVEFLEKFHLKFPKIKIIKAFKINAAEDLQQVNNFLNIADIFLFDGKNAGSGAKFDWNFFANFNCAKPWFLAGGINIENMAQALEKTGATMIDVSSGIEEIRGEKSIKLINELMNNFKNYVNKN